MVGFSRRAFLAGVGSALVGCGANTDGAATSRSGGFGGKIRAAPSTARLSAQHEKLTRVWAFDGKVPGAGIRVIQGSRIRRNFVNNLPRASSIHWHGIRLQNSMDGVPGMTQDPVPPGEQFTYDFTVNDAGTYWYHPHRDSLEQVSRGLTAPLIVKERQPPDVDADLALMINEWQLDANAQIVGFSDTGRSPGPISTRLTINGKPTLTWESKRHQRLRLRLINGTTGRTLRIRPQGLRGYVMALDGMPLAAPQRLSNIVLAPAQRADLFVDVLSEDGETAFLFGEGRALVTIPVVGDAGRSPRPAPGALPPNRETPPVLSDSRRVDLRMRAGARNWTMNGVSGMSDDPLIEVVRGETVVVRMFNENSAPHAMHLHGHHFRELRGTHLGPFRDTILMQPNQQMSIAFVADNPGDWMFHCHMLQHMADGMMTWIKVLG